MTRDELKKLMEFTDNHTNLRVLISRAPSEDLIEIRFCDKETNEWTMLTIPEKHFPLKIVKDE